MDLKDLATDSVLMIILSLIFLIAPGLVFLFYFNNELFNNLELLKLIIFSISLSAPFIAINISFEALQIVFLARKNNSSDGIDLSILTFISALISSASFFVVLFLSYIFSISFFMSVVYIILVDLVLLFLSFGILKNKK